MADFSTPFGVNSVKRLATTDEKENGFDCGPADQSLFNGLFFQLWKELDAIHQEGGVVGTDDVYNTTMLNIKAMIEAATGGGEELNYLLLSQANTRLPIYPEFLTSDGKININAPATGTVRVPAGINFLHRGISPQVTAETDFSTLASKIYHLRWNPTDGYSLKDLADVAYNPSTLAETDESFDTTYDDMLIARVTTNSSNVATITNLVNKDRIWENGKTTYTGTVPAVGGDGTIAFPLTITNNLSRVPKFRSVLPHVGATSTGASKGLDGNANRLAYGAINRYSISVSISSDFQSSGVSGFYANATWSLGA